MSGLIGCDPEFVLSNGRGVKEDASSIFKAIGLWPDTADDLNAPYKMECGVDGAQKIAELRPPAVAVATALVNSIQGLLKGLYKAGKGQVKAYAGSAHEVEYQDYGNHVQRHNYAIGGHIHLDWPTWPPSQKVVDHLNLLVALPLSLVENPDDRQQRVNRGYGWLHEVIPEPTTVIRRQAPYGFEYRPLASWLVSRYWALAVLTLTKLLHDSGYGFTDLVEPAQNLITIWRLDGEAARRRLFNKTTEPCWQALARQEPSLGKLLAPWHRVIKEQQHWACDKNIFPRWNIRG